MLFELKGAVLTIFDYAFGGKQAFLRVLIDFALPVIHLVDGGHVVLQPLIFLDVGGDQEFVDYDRTTSSCGICISCSILQLSLNRREESRVSELVSIIMKQLSLLI